jgi:teichuronic acid biosynthesis glycosyltransferase TuaG
MQNEPLVSVITPAYNAERFIEETMKSVINQQYKNWEHLIVLDCNSKDRTGEIIKIYSEKDPRIKLVTSPKAKGAANNRNVALEIAKGDYIACLDADDLWTPDKLKKQIGFMVKHNHGFTFTGFRRVSEDNSEQGYVHQMPEKINYSELLRNNCIACLTAVFKRSEFGDIRFQEHGWEDMSFWLQILKRIPYAYSVNEPLALYRIVKGSRSNNKVFAAKLRWNTYRLVEKLSLVESCYLFSIYALTAIFKWKKF